MNSMADVDSLRLRPVETMSIANASAAGTHLQQGSISITLEVLLHSHHGCTPVPPAYPCQRPPPQKSASHSTPIYYPFKGTHINLPQTLQGNHSYDGRRYS